jgi:hypothetical protein
LDWPLFVWLAVLKVYDLSHANRPQLTPASTYRSAYHSGRS